MTKPNHDDLRALQRFGSAILTERTNLIGSDFADIRVHQIERNFPQDSNGVVVQFIVSNHAIGKVLANQD